MLTQIGPNTVKSSDGFKVERIGRTELRYSEENRSTTIEVEPGERLAIFKSSITRWNPPDERESIVESDADEIIRRICLVLDFLQIPYVLD